MTQIRWLIKKDTERVLQYRIQSKSTGNWSRWVDVPVVLETEIQNVSVPEKSWRGRKDST